MRRRHWSNNFLDARCPKSNAGVFRDGESREDERRLGLLLPLEPPQRSRPPGSGACWVCLV
jgi:hypothetical protein